MEGGGGGATPAAVGDKERSLPAEIAIATAKNGLWGAALGALYSRIPTKRVTLQTPLISVRNVAVLAGVYGGTMCALREITGKDDTKARVVAGFTSGFMFYLVARRPSILRVPTAAIGAGLFFGVFNGILHETAVFGVQHWRIHMFSELEKAEIPVGARILILNHIERNPGFRKMRGS